MNQCQFLVVATMGKGGWLPYNWNANYLVYWPT